MKRALLLLYCAALLAGCGNGSSPNLGLDQPVRVRTARAQFFPGEIPHDQGGPKVATLDSANNKIRAGAVGKLFAGNAEKGTFSIGIHFQDLGSGYWVVPVDEVDPLLDGQSTYKIELEIAPDVPLGKHPFELVALDAEGHAGPIYLQDFEVISSIPKGHVVFTLRWDSQADLDLVVFTPDLKRVDGKHPSTASLDGGVDAADPSLGILDRDSNANCSGDNYNQEDLVFAGAPPHGVYQLGATMFAGCGAPAATYTITVTVDGNTVAEKSGRFVEAYDVSGGTKPVSPILKIEL